MLSWLLLLLSAFDNSPREMSPERPLPQTSPPTQHATNQPPHPART